MSALIYKRLSALERAQEPDAWPAPLIILHSYEKGTDDLVGVYGFKELPRLAGEAGKAYLTRLEAYVGSIYRSTRRSFALRNMR